MGRWLKKVQKAPGRPPTRLTQPGSVSSVSTPPGAFAKNDPLVNGDTPGPAHDIDTIIDVLARQVGRPLGEELVLLLRQAMRPMSRQARAELVAVIDDVFEVSPDLEAARQESHRMLRNAKALEAAKAVWPAYPEPPAPTEAQAPAAGHVEATWRTYIYRHSKLAPDDERYLVRHLLQRSGAEATKLARRYVETWAAGAATEPQTQRRDNAGRFDANRELRSTITDE